MPHSTAVDAQKQQAFKLLVLLCALLLATAACSSSPAAQSLRATTLEETAAAILTETAAVAGPVVLPTLTETPQPSAPPPPSTATAAVTLATSAPLPTVISIPGSGPTATSVLVTRLPAATMTATNDPNCTNDAEFVRDVSVPDGSQFAAGAPFTKTWRLRNTGTCIWDSSYLLVHLAGATLGPRTRYNLPLAVAPGQEFDLSINFTAPDEAGIYTSQWQLETPDGVRFGTRPFLQIVVAAP